MVQLNDIRKEARRKPFESEILSHTSHFPSPTFSKMSRCEVYNKLKTSKEVARYGAELILKARV